jgi:hypothetical protein
MAARGWRLSWWIGGLAGAGVLVTHWLTYRIAVPDHHQRIDVLQDTGHAHWPVFSVVALALCTAASVRVCTEGWRGRTRPGFAATTRRLVAAQAVLWLAVEVAERATTGHLATVDDHGLLLLGLALQMAVAVVGAASVWLAHRALAVLGSRRRPALPRPRPTSKPVTSGRFFRLPPLTGAHGLRGPPTPTPTS